MNHTLSSIYIPNGKYGSFYYVRNDTLVRAYISTRTGQAVSITNSSYSCLRKLQVKLIEEGIFHLDSTATNPEEFISLHPELSI